MSSTSISAAHERFLAIPGAQLYVREIGSGMPLVVLHGGPDFNHHYLLPELDGLATRLRLIYYDQRGRGKSSGKVAPEDVTIESEIEDLDRVREQLGLDAIALLGHSWGCVLAMEYTARHPDRVSHLILMNSAPGSYSDRLRFREHRQAHESEALSTMRELAATVPYTEGDVEVEARYYRAHFRATLQRPEMLEALVGRLRTHFTAVDILKARAIEDRLYAQTWDIPGYDVVARVAPTGTPALVIHGDRDMVPISCATRMADDLGASWALIQDCGHFAYLEQPAETFEAIHSETR